MIVVSALRRLEGWLLNEYAIDDRQLGLLRVAYAGFMLFLLGVPSFTWLGGAPDYFFDPPVLSGANLLGSWPSSLFFHTISVAILALFLLLLFGVGVRFVGIALFVFMLTGLNLQYSFSKIDHNILAVSVPLIMAFSGWDRTYRLFGGESRSANHSGPALATMALIIGFAMATAGLQKIQGHWLDLNSHAAYGHLVGQFHTLDRQNLLASPMLHFRNMLVWEFFDYLTVAFECLFLAAIVRRTLFRAFLVFAVVFHLGNLLILNIGFSDNFAAYLLFGDWLIVIALLGGVRVNRYGLAGAVTLLAVAVWVAGTQSDEVSLRVSPAPIPLLASYAGGFTDEFMSIPGQIAACVVGVVAAYSFVRRRLEARVRGRREVETVAAS